MGKTSSIRDKAVFIVMCVLLAALFLGLKTCSMSTPGQPGVQEAEQFFQEIEQENTKSGSKDTKDDTQSKVAKLYLGRQGVSADRVTWHEADQFADYVRQLQESGVKEVQYSLMPDSIERIEKQWETALKNANMKNYVEAD